MIITSNTLVPITDNGHILDVNGTVEVKLEDKDLKQILKLPLLDTEGVGDYINRAGLPDDIRIPDVRIRSFTCTAIKGAHWPDLSASLIVDQFDEVRRRV